MMGKSASLAPAAAACVEKTGADRFNKE